MMTTTQEHQISWEISCLEKSKRNARVKKRRKKCITFLFDIDMFCSYFSTNQTKFKKSMKNMRRN